MTVVAGVRKLSGSLGVLAELGTTSANTRIFAIYLADGGADNLTFFTKSTSPAASVASVLPPPKTATVSGIGDINARISILRTNGLQVMQNNADQGTGNYGNYPLYIGRRGGTALPFNGHLYSLVVRGAASTDSQIAATEKWTNQKTKAYA